ncbi:MAG: T9SS type A sorting domain-containing protein, partial [Ignavibacteria bacterium]|nr:T9SS type A sorting domain-containing protein [Ignavibacteria bacterium]
TTCKHTAPKTTDAAQSRITQNEPMGGNISIFGGVYSFSIINKDTLWGCGGYLTNYINYYRGFLYFTSNGGTNWIYQLPDTSFGIPQYSFVNFINKNTGWAYVSYVNTGIHTTKGGDSSFITRIENQELNTNKSFFLFQNYPNPFNPRTNINYKLNKRSQVVLKVYNITGNLISTLVDKKQTEGEYSVEYNGCEQSSGVYFYSLYLDGSLAETKKMILLK